MAQDHAEVERRVARRQRRHVERELEALDRNLADVERQRGRHQTRRGRELAAEDRLLRRLVVVRELDGDAVGDLEVDAGLELADLLRLDGQVADLLDRRAGPVPPDLGGVEQRDAVERAGQLAALAVGRTDLQQREQGRDRLEAVEPDGRTRQRVHHARRVVSDGRRVVVPQARRQEVRVLVVEGLLGDDAHLAEVVEELPGALVVRARTGVGQQRGPEVLDAEAERPQATVEALDAHRGRGVEAGHRAVAVPRVEDERDLIVLAGVDIPLAAVGARVHELGREGLVLARVRRVDADLGAEREVLDRRVARLGRAEVLVGAVDRADAPDRQRVGELVRDRQEQHVAQVPQDVVVVLRLPDGAERVGGVHPHREVGQRERLEVAAHGAPVLEVAEDDAVLVTVVELREVPHRGRPARDREGVLLDAAVLEDGVRILEGLAPGQRVVLELLLVDAGGPRVGHLERDGSPHTATDGALLGRDQHHAVGRVGAVEGRRGGPLQHVDGRDVVRRQAGQRADALTARAETSVLRVVDADAVDVDQRLAVSVEAAAAAHVEADAAAHVAGGRLDAHPGHLPVEELVHVAVLLHVRERGGVDPADGDLGPRARPGRERSRHHDLFETREVGVEREGLGQRLTGLQGEGGLLRLIPCVGDAERVGARRDFQAVRPVEIGGRAATGVDGEEGRPNERLAGIGGEDRACEGRILSGGGGGEQQRHGERQQSAEGARLDA